MGKHLPHQTLSAGHWFQGPQEVLRVWGSGDIGEEPRGPVSTPPGHLTAEAVALEVLYGPAQWG